MCRSDEKMVELVRKFGFIINDEMIFARIMPGIGPGSFYLGTVNFRTTRRYGCESHAFRCGQQAPFWYAQMLAAYFLESGVRRKCDVFAGSGLFVVLNQNDQTGVE